MAKRLREYNQSLMKCLNLGQQLQALLLKGREKRMNIRFFNKRSITLAHAQLNASMKELFRTRGNLA